MGFLQKGIEGAKLAEQAQIEYEQQKEMQGKAYRFKMKEGEKGVKITFVDGNLDPEHGVLMPDRCYEHTVEFGGKWFTFVCPEKTVPSLKDKCPQCETGKNKAALVAFFTVIDHRSFTSKDGKNTYTNQRRLFAAKSLTFEELNAQAIKRGGLAGCTFEVRRIGENSAGVGSHFDFETKTPVEVLQQQFLQKIEDPHTKKTIIDTAFKPFDYEAELVFRTGDELRKMGIGQSIAPTLNPGGLMTTVGLGNTNYAKNF